MAKLYNITLTAANPPTIGYTVYYNSVNPATIATIGLTSTPATGLTKAQLISPGLKASVPDAATSVILYNVECISSASFTVPTYVTIVASASDIGPVSLTLNWTTTPSGIATSYLIFRDGVLIATLGNVLTYGVTGLTEDTTYNFAVQAKNVNGDIVGTSNAVLATTSLEYTYEYYGSLYPDDPCNAYVDAYVRSDEVYVKALGGNTYQPLITITTDWYYWNGSFTNLFYQYDRYVLNGSGTVLTYINTVDSICAPIG
jgi:hypothetical protein